MITKIPSDRKIGAGAKHVLPLNFTFTHSCYHNLSPGFWSTCSPRQVHTHTHTHTHELAHALLLLLGMVFPASHSEPSGLSLTLKSRITTFEKISHLPKAEWLSLTLVLSENHESGYYSATVCFHFCLLKPERGLLLYTYSDPYLYL